MSSKQNSSEKIKDDLKSFFTHHWIYLAVRSACCLGIFDIIAQGIHSVEAIAQKLDCHLPSLVHLLNALDQTNFLCKKNQQFFLNEKSELLTENNPETLKYACMLWGEEHMDSWQELAYTIRTGKPSFEKKFGNKFFDFLSSYPEKLKFYHQAMREYAVDDYRFIADTICFEIHKSIMDVAGGYGVLIGNIKDRFPDVNCYLFDLPEVLKHIDCPNVKKIPGNFFEQIPSIADAIILSRVLHDWPDKQALQILYNCFQALPQQGRLYVIENFIEFHAMDLLCLNMLAICNSFERTERQYRDLLKKVGFKIIETKKLNSLQSILVAEKYELEKN